MQVKSFYLSLDKASDMFDPKKIKFATIPWEELEKEFPGFSKIEAFRQAEAYIWEKEISELFAEGVKEAFLEGYVQGFLKSAEESRKRLFELCGWIIPQNKLRKSLVYLWNKSRYI